MFRTYPTEERRRYLRRTCRYAVYCLERKKVSEAIVIDLGPLGLRMQTVKKFYPGQKFFLIYRGVPGGKLTRLPKKTLDKVESKLPCKVLWHQRGTDNSEVGVKFDVEGDALEKTWVKTVLEKLTAEEGPFEERRKYTRARAHINADLRGEGESVTGLLTNISLGGALFQSKKHLSAGQAVSLTVRSHPKLPVLRIEGDLISHSFDVVSNSGMHNIRFKPLDQTNVTILTKYVSHLLSTQGCG